MRIAMVSEHASPLAALGGVDAGGQNVHVAALSTALVARGHEVVVYTRRDDLAVADRVTMTGGVTVEHLAAGPPRPIPKDDIFPHVGSLAARLEDAWRAWRPDVVHSHFWMSGLAALRSARPLRIPVVHTFHALGTVKRRYQGAGDTSPQERVPSERLLTHRADRIVATCRDEVTELSRMGGNPGRVSVVPCGVDTDLFSPPDRPPAGGHRSRPFRLVSVGRLVERKGIDDVIRAMVHIPGAELVVAGGPDPSGLRADPDARRLTELARRVAVADRVRIVGRLDRHQVPELLRHADLAVCVPWYEPFGIVPLEAMSCAVPVVASRVGGLADTVVDGVTGLHIAPRRPLQLARAVTSLMADPSRRAAMGAAGRARVLQRYRWDEVADATLDAYETACRTGAGCRVAL